MNIYFIAGASGSGKTAVIPYLKQILGNEFAIHDFDDIGVPAGADKKWRQESTERWLRKLLSEGKDACLLGQMVLGEILACPAAKRLEKINFCLLDVNDFERIQRIKQRSTYGADQNMLNWAAWLRMHILDTHWQVHVIKEHAWDGLDFRVLENLHSWKEIANIEVIDTTGFDIAAVSKKVADWVRHKQEPKLPHGVYRHYKGQYYKVIDVAKNADTDEDMVIYRALYGEFQLYVRPLQAFVETVEVNGKPQQRFEFVREDL